jgi:hypothetical protein
MYFISMIFVFSVNRIESSDGILNFFKNFDQNAGISKYQAFSTLLIAFLSVLIFAVVSYLISFWSIQRRWFK